MVPPLLPTPLVIVPKLVTRIPLLFSDEIVPLFEQNATSRRQRDEAVSQFEVARANVEAARARLRTAELDLGYTDVRAPISGLTSREVRSEGSLVQAGSESSLLTRIVQVDPVYVEFSVPEAEAARIEPTSYPVPAHHRFASKKARRIRSLPISERSVSAGAVPRRLRLLARA